jgi:ActR/RegA family two-component response regulator
MSLGKPKLLVVEDDPSTRSSLDRVFREVGYDVKRVSANRQTTHRAIGRFGWFTGTLKLHWCPLASGLPTFNRDSDCESTHRE